MPRNLCIRGSGGQGGRVSGARPQRGRHTGTREVKRGRGRHRNATMWRLLWPSSLAHSSPKTTANELLPGEVLGGRPLPLGQQACDTPPLPKTGARPGEGWQSQTKNTTSSSPTSSCTLLPQCPSSQVPQKKFLPFTGEHGGDIHSGRDISIQSGRSKIVWFDWFKSIICLKR